MSNKSIATIATMGIDIGKNSFHVVGLDPQAENGSLGEITLGGLRSGRRLPPLSDPPLLLRSNSARLIVTIIIVLLPSCATI